MAEPERSVRVLLVDDERDFLLATAKALSKRGLAVTTAASAEEARALLQADPGIDVAVLDVRLPDGDGHALFLELKKISPDLAAIILTGNPDERRSASLAHQGLRAYIDKPCDADTLARTILEADRTRAACGGGEGRARHHAGSGGQADPAPSRRR